MNPAEGGARLLIRECTTCNIWAQSLESTKMEYSVLRDCPNCRKGMFLITITVDDTFKTIFPERRQVALPPAIAIKEAM